MSLPRRGPRPLPLHLTNAIAALTSAKLGLPLWKSGWLPSKPALAQSVRALAVELENHPPDRVQRAIDEEIRRRADAFLRGIERYRRHPWHRASIPRPVIWQKGSSRLIDYRPEGGPPLLVVPSLVNRGHILDLVEGKSLLVALAAAGMRPLLIEWGEPGEAERGFTLTHYVIQRLEEAAMAAARLAGAPLSLFGYCMGGLLAVALAQRRPDLVRRLAFLATPWDFQAVRSHEAKRLGHFGQNLAFLSTEGVVPVDVLQTWFAMLDPLLALRKFTRFADLAQEGNDARDFVAVEDWLNDGVNLAVGVARECLAGWYGENTPARGSWCIAGEATLPQRIRIPSLVVIPDQDRIVPPKSAEALAVALPEARRVNPPLGHIGMIVGARAAEAVWQPLIEWFKGSQTGPSPLSKRTGVSS